MDYQPIIIAVVSAIVGLGVWFVQSRVEKARQIENRIHDERRKIYAEILDPYIKMLSTKDQRQEDKIVKFVGSYDYKKTAFDLSLVGSDAVVLAFNEMMQYLYQRQENEEGPEMDQMLLKWGNLLLEIRKNLGEKKTKLKYYDMLRGLITDINEYI